MTSYTRLYLYIHIARSHSDLLLKCLKQYFVVQLTIEKNKKVVLTIPGNGNREHPLGYHIICELM